jgi:Phosphotransferase enzyme family
MLSFDPAPSALDTVLAPSWLSTMLAARWPGVCVQNVKVVEILATQATKVRLALDVADCSVDTPIHICIKGVLMDTGAMPSASIVETLFYREAAAELPVRVPDCIYASLNAERSRGIVVMQDVIAAGGRFCTALDPFTPAQALDGLDQLAQLHAAAWKGTSAYALDWVPCFLDQIARKPIMPSATLQELLDGPRGDSLRPAVRDARRLQRALERLAAEVRASAHCLVHGDAHAGNVYRQVDGRLGLVDWQILQKGDWAQDVAYHLAAVLSPEDRRTHERALLDDYRARLKGFGGPDLAADAAWRRYRAGMIYGLYLWAITRKVEPAIIEEFVRRLGIAVADLQSFELLGL